MEVAADDLPNYFFESEYTCSNSLWLLCRKTGYDVCLSEQDDCQDE